MPKPILCMILLMLLSACGNDKLPRFVTVQGLRVLTMTSSNPEINYDGTTFTPTTVSFTPWVSDVYGSGRALLANIYWCLDPGVGNGAAASCEGNPTRVAIATAQPVGATASFLAPNYVGALTGFNIDFSTASAAIQAIIGANFLAKSSVEQYNGVSILVFFELYPSSNVKEKVTSFRRVVMSNALKTAKNQNPTGLEIRDQGTQITGLPSTDASLEAYLPASSSESYNFQNSQGVINVFTETLETTWFLTGSEDVECSRKKACTSDGVFSLSRTLAGELNAFSAPKVSLPTSRGRVLVGVARDSRAGSVVKRYCDGSGALCP